MDCLENAKNSDFRGYPTEKYEVFKEAEFVKECSGGTVGSRHLYKKSYVSNLSDSHAEWLMSQDASAFNLEGQAIANSQGVCSVNIPVVKQPVLALQAIDSGNFYISGLEPFTRSEFESPNPLPDKSLRNRNINGIAYLTRYPHLNNNKQYALSIKGEKKDLVDFYTYDSSKHSYSDNLDVSSNIDVGAGSYQSPPLSQMVAFLGFEEGLYFANALDNSGRPYSTDIGVWLTSGMSALSLLFGGYIFAFVFAVGARIWHMFTKREAYGHFNSWWYNSGHLGIASAFPGSVDLASGTIYDPMVITPIYDSVSGRIYSFHVSIHPRKNRRSSWCIESVPKPAGQPIDKTLVMHEHWHPVKHHILCVIGVVTSVRSGFVWTQYSTSQSLEDWGTYSVRGGGISKPPKAVADLEALRKYCYTRTIQDSTQPHMCYIWLYNDNLDRVISYNSNTNTWALVRKNDSF